MVSTKALSLEHYYRHHGISTFFWSPQGSAEVATLQIPYGVFAKQASKSLLRKPPNLRWGILYLLRIFPRISGFRGFMALCQACGVVTLDYFFEFLGGLGLWGGRVANPSRETFLRLFRIWEFGTLQTFGELSAPHRCVCVAFAMAIPRCQWRHRCVVTLG